MEEEQGQIILTRLLLLHGKKRLKEILGQPNYRSRSTRIPTPSCRWSGGRRRQGPTLVLSLGADGIAPDPIFLGVDPIWVDGVLVFLWLR
jgi:hypothetical protein